MRIFKSSILKKFLGVIIIMGFSGIFLNGHVGISETVHAEETISPVVASTGTSGNSNTMGLWQILDMVLKIIYLILWPLLVLAGLALDNTLVYASIFHLDVPLWKFWNMMKNFANYALGFMVLFAIIKSILTNSGAGSAKDEKSPLGIIKMTLIAGILIQASWFLLAAVIDVSTIATYAVGGLPLSVLNNTTTGSQKILMVNSSIDLNNFDLLSPQGEAFKVWYSTTYKGKPITISPCRIVNGMSGATAKSYIIGRQFGDPEYNNATNLAPDYVGYNVCVINGSQLVMWEEKKLMDAIKADWVHLHNQPNVGPPDPNAPAIPAAPEYTTKIGYKKLLDTLVGFTGRVNKPYIQTAVMLGSGSQDGFTKGRTFFDNSTSMTISDLIKKSKGFVGPLVTIYSSLLSFSQLTDTNTTTVGSTSGVFLIKSGVAIALFFPLLALAVVLIARIGVLWLYIVASPFIIIKAAFKIKLSASLDKYLDINNVMGIIFAPVITVAALSISLIFMTALVNGFTSSASSQAFHQSMGVDSITAINTGSDAMLIEGIAQVEFTKLPWGEGLDRFSRLMVNFFAIGLMWMVVFAAIKSNTLGEKIGGGIESFGKNFFSTLPILPIGKDGERVGIGSATNVIKQLPDTYISNRKNDQEAQVREWIKTSEGKVSFDSAQANKIISATGATGREKYVAAGYKAPDNDTGRSNINTDTNKASIYESIMKDTGSTDKPNNLAQFTDIFGKDWGKAEAAKKIDPIISGISASSASSDITKLNTEISKDENKALFKNYFDVHSNTSYTKLLPAIGTTTAAKTLTITKAGTTGAETYIATIT